MSENERILRYDLQESQCRRFEALIARVVKYGKTTVENPREFGNRRGMSARTFVARFYDAMKGFEEYKYPSKVIPLGFSRQGIKAFELSNGKVEIVNQNLERLAEAGLAVAGAEIDESRLRAEIKAKNKAAHAATGIADSNGRIEYTAFELKFSTLVHQQLIERLIKEIHPDAEVNVNNTQQLVNYRFNDQPLYVPGKEVEPMSGVEIKRME